MTFYFRTYVDWDNNGNFTGTHDEITDDVMSLDWQLGFRQPYQLMCDEPTATIRVRNDFGKYNPENSGSVIAGKVQAYRPVKITAYNGSSEFTMWTGVIDIGGVSVDWNTHPDTAKRFATISCVGYKQLLDRYQVPIQYYTSTTGDVIVGAVLTAAGITSTSLQTGITALDDYGDQTTQSAWGTITEVTESEQGRFFFARDGTATWWNRHYLLTRTVLTATVFTTTGDYKPHNMSYQHGTYLANVVTVDINPRKSYASETVWELDTTITVQPGQTLNFRPRLRRSNGQFTGSGSLSATPTFSSGTAIVTVLARGGVADVTVDNSAGAIPAVMTGLVLTGTPSQNQHQLTVVVEDAASQATYGVQEHRISLPVGDPDFARDMAEFELARRNAPRSYIYHLDYKRVADGTDNLFMYQTWQVGSRLAIYAPEFGVSNDPYFVIGEHHKWNANSTVHSVRFHLEPASNQEFWTLDYSALDDNTRLAY